MRKFSAVLCTIILLFCFVGGAVAAPILDQSSPYTNTSFNAQTATLIWQQEIVVGAEGLLTTIDINTRSTGNIGFFINTGSAWQTDSNDFEISSLNLASIGWNSIDVSSANLIFDVGDTFVLGIIGLGNSNANVWLGGNYLNNGTGAYVAGELYLNGSLYANYDIAFNTYMDSDFIPANPVPEPTTMMLIGSGLLGFAGFRKRLGK